jgi:hypothetical protein
LVSGVGADANPCSRTAPCKTFAGAMSKTSAGGQINVIDAGAYGAVTIDKSITIEAEQFAGVLGAGGHGIVVNAGPTDRVVLRGLTLDGGTDGAVPNPGLDGIHFIAGGMLSVENCTIANFTQKGIAFEPSHGGAQLHVLDTVIRNNGGEGNGGGILAKPGKSPALVLIENVLLERNMFGVRVEDGTLAVLKNATTSGHTNNGFSAISAAEAVTLVLEDCVATGGTSQGATVAGVTSFGAAATITISNTTIAHNASNGLLSLGGGQLLSFGNNRLVGNKPDGTPTGPIPEQ